MAQKVGSLLISLALESGAFRSGLSQSEKELKASARRIQAVGDSMKSLGQTMSVAVTLPFAALAKSSIDAAMQSKDALAQVQQGLQTMGTAAGRTAEQLQALASSQMAKSLYDDDDILRKVTANLLTFGSISGDTFDRAQQAALDLSARLGQDLQSSTIQLGKALNDPIKGINALKRVGVSFTEQQKDQIKAMVEVGNTAGAQKLILDELAKEFGGSAEAAAKANPFTALKHAADDFQEAVGGQLLQILPNVTSALTGLLQAFNGLSPETQKTIVVVAALAAAFGPIIVVVGSMVSAIPGLVAAVSLLAAGFMAAIPAVTGFVVAASPILIPLAALAAAVLLVYETWKHWDEIKPYITAIGNAISGWWNANVKPILTAAWNLVYSGVKFWWDLNTAVVTAVANMVTGVRDWLVTKLNAVWDWVAGKVEMVKNAFFSMYDAVVGHSYVPDMVDGIAAEMQRLDPVMVQPAKKATDEVKRQFEQLKSDLASIMADLFPQSAALNTYRDELSTIEKGRKAGLISDATAEEARIRLAKKNMTNPGDGLPDWIVQSESLVPALDAQKIREAVTGIKEAANDNAKNIEAMNVRVVKSFKDMANETLSSLQQAANAIKGGGFLDIVTSVVGLLTQLGSIGLFGKKVAAKINTPVTPGRAVGGSVNAWQPYLVGEKGPELFVPGAGGGRIVPNSAMTGGGAVSVSVEASPYFDVRVNQGIVKASPAIMQGGADLSMQRAGARQYRSLAR